LIAHADYFVFDFEYQLPEITPLIATQDMFASAAVAVYELEFGFDHRGPPVV
jgi:hypothetical protein